MFVSMNGFITGMGFFPGQRLKALTFSGVPINSSSNELPCPWEFLQQE